MPVELKIIGNVRFVTHGEPVGPVVGAKIALSMLSGFNTDTDKAGNFTLRLPENHQIQEIELQITYDGKTEYQKIQRSELKNVTIEIDQKKTEEKTIPIELTALPPKQPSKPKLKLKTAVSKPKPKPAVSKPKPKPACNFKREGDIIILGSGLKLKNLKNSMSWYDAQRQAKEYGNWRLPSVNDLKKISTYSRCNIISTGADNEYWSNKNMTGGHYAHTVNLADGKSHSNNKKTEFLTILVQ